MSKIITDVKIKALMKRYNPKREWSSGCLEQLRVALNNMINYLLHEIESNAVGTKRIQPEDIEDAYSFFASAIVAKRQPILRHFTDNYIGEEE